jgi:hypothetical protein
VIGAEGAVKAFDWHSDPITRKTPITASYRNTQNVRRFFRSQCGPRFKFDRAFMARLKDGTIKTMGEAVEEWQRRERAARDQVKVVLKLPAATIARRGRLPR